jgi:hypothetical protein
VKIKLALGVAALCISAAQANAELHLLTVQGVFSATVSPNPIQEVRDLGGLFVTAAFLVDTSTATFTPLNNPSGIGQSAFLVGAVKGGFVQVGGVTLLSNLNDPGNIGIANDIQGPAGPVPTRRDQAGITSAASVINGALVTRYDVIGLPSDVYLANLSVIRFRDGPATAPPDLLTGLSLPDFGEFITETQPPAVMSLSFRRGNPTSAMEAARLPFQSLTTQNTNIIWERVLPDTPPPAVPEPASWALLIAGFGLVGAVRRRRPAAA